MTELTRFVSPSLRLKSFEITLEAIHVAEDDVPDRVRSDNFMNLTVSFYLSTDDPLPATGDATPFRIFSRVTHQFVRFTLNASTVPALRADGQAELIFRPSAPCHASLLLDPNLPTTHGLHHVILGISIFSSGGTLLAETDLAREGRLLCPGAAKLTCVGEAVNAVAVRWDAYSMGVSPATRRQGLNWVQDKMKRLGLTEEVDGVWIPDAETGREEKPCVVAPYLGPRRLGYKYEVRRALADVQDMSSTPDKNLSLTDAAAIRTGGGLWVGRRGQPGDDEDTDTEVGSRASRSLFISAFVLTYNLMRLVSY